MHAFLSARVLLSQSTFPKMRQNNRGEGVEMERKKTAHSLCLRSLQLRVEFLPSGLTTDEYRE